MCNDAGKPFIETLYNVFITPYLHYQLFYIITLMKKQLYHSWIFLHHFLKIHPTELSDIIKYHTQKHAFQVQTKEKSKPKTTIPISRTSLELHHQRLGHRPTRSIVDGDTASIWQNIEIGLDPDHLFTSRKISTINKKPISNTPVNTKTPFKWVFTDSIPDVFQPKTGCLLSLSGMQRKLFIDRRNRTNSQ